MDIYPSDLAQAIFTLRGKPLDLSEYAPFKLVYDLAPHTLVAMCGRQLGKSVSLASSIIANSILRGHFSTLFVSPLAQQTSRFSSQYLGPFINSPIVRNHFVGSAEIKNVFLRTFNNGSSVTLGYAEDEADADRVRGVSADAFFYDEVQDASIQAIPILEETLAASDYRFRRFTGTAKGESNTLTILFKRTNQMEWVVKCDHCNHYNIPNEFDICVRITTCNPNGPGCYKCAQLLNMRNGRWMAAYPDEKRQIGVHIPQFCIPARTKIDKWPELYEKVTRYDKIKLSNEVFGLPVGAGGRPLSLRQVMTVCNPGRGGFDTGFPHDSRHIVVTVLGVDWSCTGSEKSYTVATVIGFDFLGKGYVLFARKFDGMDILEQTSQIIEIFYKFECSHIGSDRGVGVMQGQTMKHVIGPDKVSMINYVAAKTNLRYDREGDYFAADRTLAIDTMVTKVKMGIDKLECPSWAVMKDFWADALHMYEEETNAGRRVYKRDEDGCDDFFHSLVFANLAYMIVKAEFVYQDPDAVKNSLYDY